MSLNTIIFTFSDSTTVSYIGANIIKTTVNVSSIYNNRANDVISVYIDRDCDIPLFTNNTNLDSASGVFTYLTNGLLFSLLVNLQSITVHQDNTIFSSISGCLYSKSGTVLYAYPIGKTSVTYTIPDIVTSICPYAFMNTLNLNNVIFNSNISPLLRPAAFAYATGLTSLIIPSNVTQYAAYVFYKCINIVSITLPNTTTVFGSYCFNECSALTSIIIPTNINNNNIYIYNNCFQKCYSLESIQLPNKLILQTGSNSVFDNCSNLRSIVIPDSVTSIPATFFNKCTRLSSISLPNTLTTISQEAFANCMNLTNLVLPNSLTSIGTFAFLLCYGLTSITITNNVTTFGNATFAGCVNLETVVINSNKITTFPLSLFNACYKLSSITIPNSVTTIGSLCFAGTTQLRSITFPDSITSIYSNAFSTSALFDANGSIVSGQTRSSGLQTVYMTTLLLKRLGLTAGLNATLFGASNVTIVIIIPTPAQLNRRIIPPGYIENGRSFFSNNLVYYMPGSVSGNTHSGVSNSRVVRRRT